jgi:hypothetical protein
VTEELRRAVIRPQRLATDVDHGALGRSGG